MALTADVTYVGEARTTWLAGATPTDRLRVATWNVREALSSGPSVGLPGQSAEEIAELLRVTDVDVVALQEVDFDREGASITLAAIAAGTDLRHHARLILSSSSFEPGRSAGVAVCSRVPIIESQRLWLNRPTSTSFSTGQTPMTHDKGALNCRLNLGYSIVNFLSLHSFPFHRVQLTTARSLESEVLRRISLFMESLYPAPTILCGDFNSENRGKLQAPGGKLLTSLLEGYVTHRSIAADDIMVSAPFALVDVPAVVENSSDHKLCIAELKVQTRV